MASIVNVVIALFTWAAYLNMFVCYLRCVWKAWNLGGWLWAGGCLFLPIPVIPIFTFVHWSEMRDFFLYLVASFGFFALMCVVTMARGR